jgi:hypothetical protein
MKITVLIGYFCVKKSHIRQKMECTIMEIWKKFTRKVEIIWFTEPEF